MRGFKAMALVASALSLAALAGACSDGRFPVCKSNEDCAAAAKGGSGGKVCFNLKCVECQYDSDCASGKACNRNLNTCQSILDAKASEEPKEPQTSWEPANWDECATRCKEQACLNDCDARFKK